MERKEKGITRWLTSACAFPTVAGFIDRSSFVSGTGGWLERHYSDESSKRNDSDSTHGDSLWTDREDRESDTPVASQHFPPPVTPAAVSAQPIAQPSQEDKAKVFAARVRFIDRTN